MRIEISPSKATGTIMAPPSKSMAHRLLICAALAKGTSTLTGMSDCEDVLATIDCLRALGVDCTKRDDTVTVNGGLNPALEPLSALRCRESGSTIRFLIPVALLSGKKMTLTGAPALLRRPMTVYETLCREKGLLFEQTADGFVVKGPLTAGEYTLPGNVSSQFISGMLFALTQTTGKSTLKILPPLESRSYLHLTVSALREFGADVTWTDDYTLKIDGGMPMRAHDCAVEGDYSNAAFLEAFNLFGGEVTVGGLRGDSLQGDRVYRDCFAALLRGGETVSLENCPDLGPILFAVAAAKRGGRFTNTRRLKIKESDRAEVMAQELRKFGATVRVYENNVEIEPTAFHTPTEPLCGHNDHRIVMSLAILASVTGGVIEGAEAAAKSFPDFFDRIRSIGIAAKEI
ncbi:MAG: 3-phosphoshikimate 1-carboxyvinyltransferase [Clostridia bacterium]|nr:3-phosphoshikimate 1-carboxyvinyltransferase [Clostridia bacterium]